MIPLCANLEQIPPSPPAYEITVNTPFDGEIRPDAYVTLRESIALSNGTLTFEELTPQEQENVKLIQQNESENTIVGSRIEFNLPPDQTTISLIKPLPPILSQGTIIDGTTQRGYQRDEIAQNKQNQIEKMSAVSTPVVAITPKENNTIAHGLSIIGSHVIIRGLSLYGFNLEHNPIAQTPPANIIIGCQFSAPPKEEELITESVIVNNNWLGRSNDPEMNDRTSGFGVFIWNGNQTKIINNQINYNSSSGILSSGNANELIVKNNEISHNGLQGMADGIRLEGNIDRSRIRENYIHSNGGSGIYLFKPHGAIGILNNRITNNGQTQKKAAIYIMGNNHRIVDNRISQNNGSGIVVAAYPQQEHPRNNAASGNIIARNRFGNINNMSIDLITRNHTGIQALNLGDGVNPTRESPQRRNDTANAALQTPQFISREFFRLGGVVEIKGKADPRVVIELYRVDDRGELNIPLAMIETNEQGEFVFRSRNLYPGEKISAVAVDLSAGTSEPATRAIIQSLDRRETRE